MSGSVQPRIARRYQQMTPEESGFTVGRNVDFVVRNALCHGCGTCEAACPSDAIRMSYQAQQGIYLPQLDPGRCDECTLCVQACPGFELDLTVQPNDEPGIKQHLLVGPHLAIYRAYATDATSRSRAASGGLVTAIVDFLMDSNRVDGAILTRMRDDAPLQAEGYVATGRDQLAASQKSKYCPVPLNRVLKQFVTGDRPGRFVFVGLPHHIHGLRLLQRLFPALRQSIPYAVSLFTAHVPSQRATEFILHEWGIDPARVRSIEYRGGGNPGRMRIVTDGGGEYHVPHLHWTYYGHAFPLFFYPVREWLYFDKLSEWADFSCGDNWMGGLAEQEGTSTVVTRCAKADAVIQAMIAAEQISATPMSADDLATDQDLENKLNIRTRLLIWKAIGRKVPIYTRTFAVQSGQLLRTARFALYVLLCERKVPFGIMGAVIRADYLLRARPLRALKKISSVVRRVTRIFMPYRRAALARNAEHKVVLIGGYGYKDIGDEAMPHAVRRNLRRALGDSLELVMLSPDPAGTREFHGETSRLDFTRISFSPNAGLPRKLAAMLMTAILLLAVVLERRGIRLTLWTSAREALDEIASADLVLNVGGGNVTTVIPSEFYRKCTTYLVARLLGKPVFLSGQTMGPFAGWLNRHFARICLDTTRMISFRDKAVSHQRLADLGVKRPVMFDAADDAITLDGIPENAARALLQLEAGRPIFRTQDGLLVLLNIKASLSLFKGDGRDTGLDNEVILLARIADALIEAFGCTVGFLPTDFSAGVDDRVYHARAFAAMQCPQAAFVVEGEYSDDELIGMIGCADVVVGSRYHFNVFAASRAIPFLGIASGIYQRTKLQGLAALCDLPQCYVDMDMEFAAFDAVWPCVAAVVEQRAAIHRALAERVPLLRAKSMAVVAAVVDVLNSRQALEQRP